MRPSGAFSAGAAVTTLLTLLSCADFALARPNCEERVSAHMRWSNQRGGKLSRTAVRNVLGGPSYDNSEAIVCNTSQANTISTPYDNVWAGLSNQEAVTFASWPFGQKRLNLTAQGTLADGTTKSGVPVDILLIGILVELQPPNKAAVLAHIDGGGAAPERWAHVVLDCRATEDAHYRDVLVGPLPLDSETATIRPLEYSYTRKTEGKVRNLEASARTMYNEWLYKIGAGVADITQVGARSNFFLSWQVL
ncbi:hypothetical protein LQW54_003446 [Pestalotiopsis sp. IQ-011]